MAWGFNTISSSQKPDFPQTSLGISITQAPKIQESTMTVTPLTGIVQSPTGISAESIGVALGTGVKVLAGNVIQGIGNSLSTKGQEIVTSGQQQLQASLSPFEKLFDFAGTSFGKAFGTKTVPYILLIGGAILLIYFLRKKGG